LEIGESLVSAYFKYVEGKRLVIHNVPFDQGQGEIDLIVVDPLVRRSIFCEVTTHLEGMLYGDGNQTTATIVRKKLERCRAFANSQFPGWTHEYQIWSPRVPSGLVGMLEGLCKDLSDDGLSVAMVINEVYSARVDQVRAKAAKEGGQTDEPAFRMLQILARLK
jgi:Holliday junction resolvase-like predicted endonuclease